LRVDVEGWPRDVDAGAVVLDAVRVVWVRCIGAMRVVRVTFQAWDSGVLEPLRHRGLLCTFLEIWVFFCGVRGSTWTFLEGKAHFIADKGPLRSGHVVILGGASNFAPKKGRLLFMGGSGKEEKGMAAKNSSPTVFLFFLDLTPPTL